MGGEVSMPAVSGPLASWVAGYGDWLAARGYASGTASQKLRQLRDRKSVV